MPPQRFSRHLFTLAITDVQGRRYLTEREPVRFRSLPDNIQHRVQEGETLWILAYRFYQPLPRPSGLWWVIADFQPDPILDPTLALEVGRVLVIPSLRTVREVVFGEERRRLM